MNNRYFTYKRMYFYDNSLIFLWEMFPTKKL